MQADVRRPPPLETLTPVLVAVGLAHLLLAALIWIFLPLLGGEAKTTPQPSPDLTWVSPSAFIGATSPAKLPPPSTEGKAQKREDASPALSLTLADGKPVTPSPAVSLNASPQQEKPPAAAAEVQGSLQGMLNGQLAPSPAAGLTINSMTPTAPSVSAPAVPVPPLPAVSENEPEANKYLSVSALAPDDEAKKKVIESKPVLNLLDIAKLNETARLQSAVKGGADMSGVEKTLQQAILREWKAPPIRVVPFGQRRLLVELSIGRDGSVQDARLRTSSGSEVLDRSVREALKRVAKIPETLPSSFPKERYDLRVTFLIE